MMNVEGKRNIAIDSVGGLLIIWMVLHHIFIHADATKLIEYRLLYRILFFFMPWFFYKAGIFFRNCSYRKLIKKDFHRLFIPFIFWTVIGFLCYALTPDNWENITFGNLFVELLQNGALKINLVLWFLSSLIVIRLINNLILTPPYLAIYALCMLVFSWILYHYKFDSTYILPEICTGGFFFAMGRLCHKIQYEKIIFYLSLIVFGTITILCFSSVTMRRNVLENGNYMLWFVSSLSGIIVINNVFNKISECWLNKLQLYKIGIKTMFVYVTHILLMYPMSFVIETIGVIDPRTKVLIYIIWLSVTLPLVQKLLYRRSLSWSIGS